MEDVFEEADALPEEFQSMSADDLKRRARLLDNEIRVCAGPCSPSRTIHAESASVQVRPSLVSLQAKKSAAWA